MLVVSATHPLLYIQAVLSLQCPFCSGRFQLCRGSQWDFGQDSSPPSLKQSMFSFSTIPLYCWIWATDLLKDFHLRPSFWTLDNRFCSKMPW